MPKKIIQDIVPKSPKTTKAKITESKTKVSRAESAPKDDKKLKLDNLDFFSRGFGEKKYTLSSKDSSFDSKKILSWAGGILIFVLLVGWGMTFFTTVTLRVEPSQEKISVDDVFLVGSVSGGELSFQTISLTGEESVQIPLTETRKVESKASGLITIYNEFSQSPQQLVAKTRFQTADGKIFRIEKGVTIPGGKLQSGKIVPGTVEVAVVADQTGVEYNVPASNFTIPGFSGTQKFSKIYAKSFAPTKGGFSGQIKTASDETFDNARKELEGKIGDSLAFRASAEVPKNFILYRDAMFVSMKDNRHELAANSSDKFTYKLSADFIGLMINKKELEQMIVRKSVKRSPIVGDSFDVNILGLENMSMNLIGKSGLDPLKVSSFSFRLTGQGVAVWQFDHDLLKNRLVGIKKASYQDVFKEFPVIDTAHAIISPKWSRTFPKNPEKISIELIINK